VANVATWPKRRLAGLTAANVVNFCGGAMQLGVVSDTHGHIGSTTAAVRILAREKIDTVLHCGDIGSPSIVPLFAGFSAHFVFGNVDHDEGALSQAIEESGQTCHGRFGSLILAGWKVAWLHSDDHELFEETVESGDWDLVCYGHTHVAEQHLERRTLVLNPGALFRASPRTLAIVDLADMQIRHIAVES
jgi:putative phosphoesterase